MTNWMTAAGLAFIAGGLATLISFRAVLFGRGARRPSARRRSETTRPAPAPRVRAEVPAPRPQLETRPQPEARVSGLAIIGLADADEDEDHEEAVLPDPAEEDPWPPRRRRREPEPDGRAWAHRDAETPLGYAGRYQDRQQPEPVGDYWTPVPDDLYSASAMSPLPPVPDYEPATGFDLPPIPATGPMPEWPPRRIRLPRSWAERSEPEKRSTPYVSRHSLEGH